MTDAGDALKIILVIAVAFGAAYFLTNTVFQPQTPEVYSFTVEDKQVNDLALYYTIPAGMDCSENFAENSTRPEVNIGTFNPAEDVLLLKTYPGERLKFCNPENFNSSDSFQVRQTVTQGLFVTPDWIEVGTGKIQLTHRSMSDEEMQNATDY